MAGPWQRYCDVIPNFPNFIESHREIHPISLISNPLKISTVDLIGRLQAQDPHAKFLAGDGELNKVVAIHNSSKPWGRSLEHALGLFYILGTSSIYAARELAIAPGEKVLDLCAAPGGKTIAMSAFYGEKYFVIANECDLPRLRILQGNLDRWGLTHVATTHLPGEKFPLHQKFDRIMLDAPCSSEGTWFGRDPSEQPGVNQEYRAQLNRIQLKLLQHAFALLRPGGHLLYATCTYAPEENEGVISDFLNREEQAEIIPVTYRLPSMSPALDQFQKQIFHPDLKNAVRIYPHQSSSHGFFYAKISRKK